MIGKLARRLGFQPSVPVALIDDWITPTIDRPLIELAPREGAASCQIDQHGRIQVVGDSWSLDLTLAAGARWVPVATSDKVKQRLIAPGVVETTVQTPSGPVVQRIAAGVVDAEPVVIIEVENTAGVAIAVGVAARPLQHDGRGYIGQASIDGQGIVIDDRHVARFETAPASVKAIAGTEGDVLQAMPDAEKPAREASASCRSGGAQVAAVWPLPHTATLRLIIELDEPTAAGAAVPTTADVNRGWAAHLKQGMRVAIDDVAVDEDLAVAARSLLTLWPEPDRTPAAVIALSELGYAVDAGRLFSLLERSDDDAQVVRSLARWAQLGDQARQLEDVERILGRLARAAHGIDQNGGDQNRVDQNRGDQNRVDQNRGDQNRVDQQSGSGRGVIGGPAWLESGLIALGGLLHQIDQPEVGERIQGFSAHHVPIAGAADLQASLAKARTKRGVWPDGQVQSSSQMVMALRSLLIDDSASELRLLPELPKAWRGRTIDVFGVPVANGSISFGLRWHGPRPAILWEANLLPDVPLQIAVPGIDSEFMATEHQGEALLADPGWKT